jgi:dethiobiotin synthetase
VSERVVVVSGTGTGVGKTWLTVGLVRLLAKEGLEVTARKPVQSFDPAEGSTDAALLGAACGEEAEAVCPGCYSYPRAMAPPIAARDLGLPPPRLADLLAATPVPPSGLVLFEGVGGPRSPLALDADTVSLAQALDAGLVVVVAPSGLGSINDVTLSVEAFGSRPTAVFLNRFDHRDPVHAGNFEWLRHHIAAPVHGRVEDLVDGLLQAAVVS